MIDDKKGLYTILFFGVTGPVFVLLGAMKFFNFNDWEGVSFTSIGFLFTMFYMNYLESKAGISNTLIWIRSILSIVLFYFIAYFFFILKQ
ncbi:hypothetical protein SAMN05877753_102609 [Bacillus oleivorans]|uniref:EamA-like transporter family protein n=1 Tax=Bacillus oleivorans TaxID=1448271 RepID=A0A285CM11_9BACI|nr:hypothetical protein [Bacillus oleivorans]SNX68589.1 hypothetical protein SAMN05877753_102609 [Bacillus oleivorans]